VTCERGMTARGNFVVDVSACVPSVGRTIARDIGEKVSGQR
jgi:hypothetical protein